MEEMRFVFGKKGRMGRVDFYRPGGYGFVTEKERLAQEELRIFELNSGFDVPYWYRGERITFIRQGDDGCYVDSDKLTGELWERDGSAQGGEQRHIPLCFKATVAEAGNYEVHVLLKAAVDEPEVLLFMGRRHLVWKGSMRAGECVRRKAMVNICDVIPNGRTGAYEDRTLDLALVGKCPILQGIYVTRADCPTVYMAGDSTMADYGAEYPYHPSACYGGWGQAFDAWLNGGIAVCNQAHNGRTTESFRAEGHYEIVMKAIRPGDYFMMQFGHNDQKHGHLQAWGGYRDNLKRFIEEIREKGAYPVLLTPIARNTWQEEAGKPEYNDLLYEHAEACIRIGTETGVPVLDLHGDSMEDIRKLGREASKAYYHADDWTHTNDNGAYRAAGYVAGELRKMGTALPEYRPLVESVGEGFGVWMPSPDTLPLVKPERLAHMEDSGKEADSEAERNHQAEMDGARLRELVGFAKKKRRQNLC